MVARTSIQKLDESVSSVGTLSAEGMWRHGRIFWGGMGQGGKATSGSSDGDQMASSE